MASNPDHPQKSINLLRGWPSTGLLPTAALKAASQRLLSNPALATPALLYGPDPGFEPLRGALAAWLAEFYGTAPDAERIAVSGGASQSLACILQSFTDPAYTRAVWMVSPCYFLACPIFADAGLGGTTGKLRSVPEDAEGIDLEFLEAGLRKMSAEEGGGGEKETKRFKDPGPHRKLYRHVVYCVPSFSNPSGMTMSRRQREGLLELARRYDALVVCDDVYDMLQWQPTTTATTASSSSSSPEAAAPDLNQALLPRLIDLERALGGPSEHDPPGKSFGHAVSNGSFSKLAGPGLRTGWTESTPDFAFGLSQTGSTRSGGAPSQFAAAVVYELLVSGSLASHLREALRPAYRRRHGLVADALKRELAPLYEEDVAAALAGNIVRCLAGRDDVFGGYFVWFRLPGNLKASDAASRCMAEENLAIGTGGLFAVQGDETGPQFEHEVRLCFAWEDEADLKDGVLRLSRVLRRMLDGEPMREGAAGEKGLDELK